MKTKHAKSLLIFSTALLMYFSLSICHAQQNSAAKNPSGAQFYSFLAAYNSKDNTVKLSDDKKYPPIVSPTNYLQDTGSGSQFYAKLLNINKKYVAFSGNTDKWYLGDWSKQMIVYVDGVDKDGKPTRATQNVDSANIKVSVPYSAGGKMIEIYDAKSNKLAFAIEVTKFAQVTPAKAASAVPQMKKATPVPQKGIMMALIKKWQWPLLIVLVVVILIVAFFAIRKRMKKNTVELSRSNVARSSGNIKFKK